MAKTIGYIPAKPPEPTPEPAPKTDKKPEAEKPSGKQ